MKNNWTTRLVDDAEYNMLCDWWKKHNWVPPPQEILPSRGYVVFDAETPIIAGFLYKDETSAFGMLEWIVSNPSSTKEQRDIAFPELMKDVEKAAKEIGVKALFTSAFQPRLIKRFTELNFFITGQNMTHFIKGVL